MNNNGEGRRVRINFTIKGEIAQFLIEGRLRGRFNTYTEAVLQGLAMLQKEEIDTQMNRMRLQQMNAN